VHTQIDDWKEEREFPLVKWDELLLSLHDLFLCGILSCPQVDRLEMAGVSVKNGRNRARFPKKIQGGKTIAEKSYFSLKIAKQVAKNRFFRQKFAKIFNGVEVPNTGGTPCPPVIFLSIYLLQGKSNSMHFLTSLIFVNSVVVVGSDK
jgi:hypothetical protein